MNSISIQYLCMLYDCYLQKSHGPYEHSHAWLSRLLMSLWFPGKSKMSKKWSLLLWSLLLLIINVIIAFKEGVTNCQFIITASKSFTVGVLKILVWNCNTFSDLFWGDERFHRVCKVTNGASCCHITNREPKQLHASFALDISTIAHLENQKTTHVLKKKREKACNLKQGLGLLPWENKKLHIAYYQQIWPA